MGGSIKCTEVGPILTGGNSPETIRNQKLDHRSDIYSLGATFYHLIAGSPPFADVSLRKILHKHLNEAVPPLKQRAPNAPEPLCRLIEKMLAKRIEDRFDSYGEIIDRIDRFFSQKPSRSLLSTLRLKLKTR